ncbi:hypothetical protein [Teredinibacter waterburyi]|uniref:hypothetical protein n=1 Tax=Teredinibacter waterburyi TaxID=1500538 RepID=UPI00165EF072|nr:hypothetical protein [Teredinibacter waterburyi]
MSKQKILPNGLGEDVIARAYKKELARHQPQLIGEIKQFLAEPISEDIKGAYAEIFPDEYGDGYVGIGLYLEAITIKHIGFADYVRDLPSIDVFAYQENDVSIPDLVVNLVKQWFAESWFKAGGWDYPLAIDVNGHDGFGDGESIVLTSKS